MLRTKNLLQSSQLRQLLRHSAIYGMLSICIFSMYSCQEDVDELVGSWILKDLNLTNCADATNNQSFSFDETGCTELQGALLCTTGVITFREDGTYSNVGNVTFDGDVINDLSDSGTWSRTGMSVVLCDSTGDCNGSTIQINGDKITVRDEILECNRSSEYERI